MAKYSISDFEKWLKWNCGSPKTLKAYLDSAHLYLAYLMDVGKEPSTETMREYLVFLVEEKGLSASTVNIRKHGLIKLQECFKIPGDEIRKFKTPKIKRRMPTVLIEEDRDRILAVIRNPLDRAQFMLMYDAALRVQELMMLTKEDLEMKKGFLRVPVAKRDSGLQEEYCPIQQETYEAVQVWCMRRGVKEGPLWPPDMKESRPRSMMRRLCKQAGVKPPDRSYYNPHSLRHGRAMQVYRGADRRREVVQKLLRHRSASSTDVYARLDASDLQELAPPSFPGLKKKEEPQ